MNITLIGMPGSGKSTVGLALARLRSMRFVDGDKVIIAQTGKPLSLLLDELGDEGFRHLEEDVIASLDVRNSVISPGGSVVYGERAMTHLREISRVIYLQVDLPKLRRRLGDLHARGVTLAPGQTLESLYAEREPLYLRYAHHTINAADMNIKQLAEEISAHCQKRH